MKAYVITEGRGLDALQLKERNIPKPGPGEILVRMKASAINYRDFLTISFARTRGITEERIPNSDGAGVVEEVGAGVTVFKSGDRVVGCFFQDWIGGSITDRTMASAIDGVLAEYAIFKENGALQLPAHMSFEEASTLPCAGLTAWNCLIEKGAATAGSSALLLGTGGVSIFALQMAKANGIRTIVTSSSDEKLARVKEMGANDVINYRKTPDWELRVKELTGGHGVDVVVEVGGAGTLEKSVQSVRVGGTISLVGVLTGGQVDPTSIMRKSVCLQGIYVGPKNMFEKMNAALVHNNIHPVIDEVVGFSDARKAYELMESGAHFGKIVISIP